MNRFRQAILFFFVVQMASAQLLCAGTFSQSKSFWQIDLEHHELATPDTLRNALLALEMPEPKKTVGKFLFEYWVKTHPLLQLVDEQGGNKGVSIIGADDFNIAVPVSKGSFNIRQLVKVDQFVGELRSVLGVQNMRIVTNFADLRYLLKQRLHGMLPPVVRIFIALSGRETNGLVLPRQENGSPKPLGFAIIVKPGQTLQANIAFWPYHDSEKGIAVLKDNNHVLSFNNFDGFTWIGGRIRGAKNPHPTRGAIPKGDAEWTYKNTSRTAQTIVFVGHYKTNTNKGNRKPSEVPWLWAPHVPVELSPLNATVCFDDPATDKPTPQFPNIWADMVLKLRLTKAK